MELEELKTFCRIDGTADDDQLMNLFLPAAITYLDNAVDNKSVLTEKNPTYRLTIMLLVNHWYNNRDTEITGTTVATMPKLLQVLLQQLQHTAEVEA